MFSDTLLPPLLLMFRRVYASRRLRRGSVVDARCYGGSFGRVLYAPTLAGGVRVSLVPELPATHNSWRT
jgi:hypothetical protein